MISRKNVLLFLPVCAFFRLTSLTFADAATKAKNAFAADDPMALAATTVNNNNDNIKKNTDSIPKNLQQESRTEKRTFFNVVDTATAVPLEDGDFLKKNELLLPPSLLRHARQSHRNGRRHERTTFSKTIDIYIRTYKGDAPWLMWLFRSIEENIEANAFRRVIVSCNRRDSPLFLPLVQQRHFTFDVLFLITDDAAFEIATKAMNSITSDGGYHAQMWDKVGWCLCYKRSNKRLG